MRKYAKGQQIVNGIIVVDSDTEFDDNPLFYVWGEYPTYSIIENGYRMCSYEFYLDKNGNRYMIISDYKENLNRVPELLKKADWNWARNVDEFVEGADIESYKHWLELIS